jgi:Spy/CpxP family protein refolding chaperone
MKLRWITGILMAVVLALSAMAQADHPQLPDTGGATATEPSNDSAVTPNSMPQPQNSLNAYEQQMAIVTVQTYTELTQIAEALHSGQISSERAEYLTRRCFEVGVVRLQFLDTLHLIAESKLSREAAPENSEEQTRQMEASGETLVVPPPAFSSKIPESVVKSLELTPPQIAIIQVRVAEAQREIQPLLQRLLEHKKEIVIATHTKQPSNRRIRKLAVEQSRILERLIVANSRLQQDIYSILTAEQRQKLDSTEQGTVDVTTRLFAPQ